MNERGRPELLSKFTPSTLSSGTLEAILVHREPVVERIVSSVRASLTTRGREHHLVTGQRGMGKTHLISVAVHRLLADPELDPTMALAWLREEEWGVTSIEDFYERILMALAAAGPLSAEASTALADLRAMPADRFEAAIEASLTAVVGDRTLVVVMENLDQLFKDIGSAGQHSLRAYLQTERNAVVVATTPALNSEISRRSGLFFGFFAIHRLDELDVDAAQLMLTRIAEWRGDDAGRDLIRYFTTTESRQRLRAIYELTGGTPRLWMILSECITSERLEELIELLVSALDDLTPFYQSQMKALSPHQRKVLMTLSRLEGAATVREIASLCRIEERAAAKHLRDLTQIGFTRVARAPSSLPVSDGRNTYYELHEPLMRHCLEVKESRGEPLRAIVGFLRAWYSADALEVRLNAASGYERPYLEAALASLPSRPNVGRPSADEPMDDRVSEVIELLRSERSEEALRITDTLLEADSKATALHGLRGIALANMGRYEEALTAYDTALQHWPDHAVAAYNSALVVLRSGGSAAARLEAALSARPDDEAIHGRNAGFVATALRDRIHSDGWLATCVDLATAYRGATRLDLLAAALTGVLGGLDDRELEAWRAGWAAALSDDPEAAPFLRMLDAVIEIRATGTGDALLRLSQEERDVVIEALGLGEDESDEDGQPV